MLYRYLLMICPTKSGYYWTFRHKSCHKRTPLSHIQDSPSQFLNQANVFLRIIVDTDGSINYGSPQDNFEGVFVTDVSLVTPGVSVHWSDDLGSPTTFTHYAETPPQSSITGSDDWGHIQLFGGSIDRTLGFENSFATPPDTEHVPVGANLEAPAQLYEHGFPDPSLTL